MRLSYDDTEWRVSKTFGDIYSLHRSLIAARAKAKVKNLAHAYRNDRTGDKFPHLPNAAKLGYNEDSKEQNDFGQVTFINLKNWNTLTFNLNEDFNSSYPHHRSVLNTQEIDMVPPFLVDHCSFNLIKCVNCNCS